MGFNDYECDICGKVFDYMKPYVAHKRTCGISTLDEFDELDESMNLSTFRKRMDALRKNDYDKNDKNSKSRQVNLKNRVVKNADNRG